jgi:prephenate dehydratase
MKVAFQGERGAFSETAAKKYFDAGVSVSPSFSFEDVFVKVKNKFVDSGIIPIENTLYGSIYETYDLLLKYSLTINGELSLQINHHLLSNNLQIIRVKKLFIATGTLGSVEVS